jgi:ketosteroid isomerase-like protein
MQFAVTNPSMHMSRRLALVSMLVAVLAQAAFANPQRPGMPRAQKHDARHEIDQLEEAWRNAILTSNSAVMGTLLADDYMAITARGTLQTKEQALARLASGRVHYTSLELSDRKVRFYGTTALVTSLAQATGSNSDGEDISGSYRYTRVYVRNAQGKWKIVSFEASRIRQPGERR